MVLSTRGGAVETEQFDDRPLFQSDRKTAVWVQAIAELALLVRGMAEGAMLDAPVSRAVGDALCVIAGGLSDGYERLKAAGYEHDYDAHHANFADPDDCLYGESLELIARNVLRAER